MKHVFSLGSCLLLLLCASALAQTPAPTQRIRGDVVAIDGSNLQVKARSGETLSVKLADNYVVTAVVKIVMPEDVPIVTFEPGDKAMLVPGAHVLLTATKQPDGSLTAARVAVGKNGLVPPM